MDSKIRVGAVSYLNTKPLVYGFEKGEMNEAVELSFEYPSLLAEKLLANEIDIGLIPVAAIPSLPESHIITDLCIGANGTVASVCLFSEVPIEKIETIYLDYQSRTSVALLKVLLLEYWKVTPQLLPASPGYQEKINGAVAGLVIGDRAFAQRKKSTYIYDLAEAWTILTGLPFVFAAWVANKKLDKDFIQKFGAVSSRGFSHLPEIVNNNVTPNYDLLYYYQHNISYTLDARKKEGLHLFLKKLKKK